MLKKEKILFIDIDGVLFGNYDGYYQLRPGVSSFFVWASRYFRCEFLTCWSWPRVQTLLESLYIDRRSLRLGYREWYNYKTDGIDLQMDDFYLIDDNLLPEEISRLKEWGLENRYVKVNKEGSEELKLVKERILTMENMEFK